MPCVTRLASAKWCSAAKIPFSVCYQGQKRNLGALSQNVTFLLERGPAQWYFAGASSVCSVTSVSGVFVWQHKD